MLMQPVAIPRAGTGAILARLEEERASFAGTKPILASDGDGTLWNGDVGFDLFEAVIEQRAVRPEARDALAAEALAIGVTPDGDASTLAVALYEAYQAGRYPHGRAFAMMAWVFAGYRREELAAFCARVLDDGFLEARIRSELRVVFAWAARRGIDVYVVSASPRAIVELAVAHLGVPPDHVAAMTPALAPTGMVLPRLDGPVVYGDGKLDALERVCEGGRRSILGAFGDMPFDAPLLRAARVPVAVTPTPGLTALAPTIPGLVMLDR